MATTKRFDVRDLFAQGAETITRLFHEGNVRRMTIRDEQGRTFLEMPLNVGIVSVMLAPVWVAIGFVTAIATGYTVTLGKGTKVRPPRMTRTTRTRAARRVRRPERMEPTEAAH